MPRKAGLKMVFCSYPITPASALLHHLAKLRGHGVTTFQAEDEIAAACAAIGASYAGSLGVTASSGPGIALKTEAIGLAVATELPLVIVNAQRGGPSTGLPTKTEQSDLYQAVMGRNGDTPIVVLAAATPSDCFAMAREAVRIAVHHMTPVMLLTDGFLANSSEPWLIPDVDATPAFPVRFRTEPEGFHPFLRDERLVRPWVKPGTPGLEHRIGGIEKDYDSGNISYDPANHQRMTDARWNKVLKVADDLPEQACEQGAAGRRPRRRRLGQHLRPDRPRRARRPRARPGRRPHPPAPPLAPAPQSRRAAALLPAHPGARDEPGPARDPAAQRVPRPGQGPVQGHRPPVHHRRARRRDRRGPGGRAHERPRHARASPRTTPPTRRSAGAPAAATTRSSRPC